MWNFVYRKEVKQMSNEVKVRPTPIQRNLNDVAMELTQLYYKGVGPESVEELQKTYCKMYATAQYAVNNRNELSKKITPNLLG